MNYEKYCRICLESKDDLLDLEAIYDEDRQLNNRDILELITNINILEETDTEFPKQLCSNCGEELQMCYNFHKKVEYSNQVIKHMQLKKEEEDDEAVTSISITFLENLDDNEEEEQQQMKREVKFEDSDVYLSDNEIKPNITYELLNEIDHNNEFLHDAILKDSDNEAELEEKYLSEEDSLTTFIVYKPHNDSPGKKKKVLTNKDVYECKSCHKKFANKRKLISHQHTHNPNRPKYECSDCTRIYATKQGMETHVSTVHKKKGFKCKYCDKVFATRKGLIIHMRFHTGDFPYECDQCERKFAQLCHLKTHINVKHKNARFTCDYANCKKYFTNSASLRNHEYTHSTMPFICEFCDKGYPAKSKLRVHVRQKHGKDMSIDELERMRVFHVPRTPLKLVELDTTIR